MTALQEKKQTPILHLTGGALSGMVACVALQPLDLIKTRLQQHRQDHLAFLKEAKNKGLKVAPQKSGLWRGTIPTIMRNVPGSALYFFALSEIRQIVSNSRSFWKPVMNNNKDHQRWENLFSGSTARGAVGYIMMPITVVKVRYESNLYNYTSLSQAFTSIVRTDGIRGLFAGYGATFIRDAPFAGIYLFFYEGFKSWANDYADSHQKPIANALVNLGSGVAAGMAATCTTQPFDMLKTRMQLKPVIYKNLLQSAKKVYLEEGIMGFFDGISVRLIRKPLNSAISWTIYEEVNHYELKHLKFRGVPKGLLPLSGKPAVGWLYDHLKDHFSQTYIVANAYNFKHYERWASSVNFPRENILNKGLSKGILADLAFLHRVKGVDQDIVITFPHVFWDESEHVDRLLSCTNFTLCTAYGLPVAFGLSLEAVACLDEYMLTLEANESEKELVDYVKRQESNSFITIAKGATLFDFADPTLSFQTYLDHWENCMRYELKSKEISLKTNPIHQRAYARVGLMGNPSDGFFGKTMSLLVSNFWAEATLIPNTRDDLETITILPNPVSDPHNFSSMACLAGISEIDGYETGDRLLQACCKVFYRHCQSQGIQINTQQGFKMMFETNVPRQVGLAGSSAIITALWKALMVFYDVSEEQIPLELQASLVLKVEQEELGIAAGLQDRVIQSFGGLVYMDFNKEYMEKHGYGKYERLKVALLPKLWLAYIADPEDSGKVHSTVKQRFLNGEPEIMKAMEKFASFTDEARLALERKDHQAFAQLMSSNFNLRRQVYGDAVVGASNLRMIELARQHNCAAKFPGSGGAVVGMWNGPDKDTEQKDLLSLRRALESEGFVFVMLSPKVYEQ
ncbi:hypothetical protein G6F43_011418 [Rhizopus delemar]|nr:hypothetical protein G6F43_011418 [Rhizopus delemar]